MTYTKLTRDAIAQRVAQDIPEGAYVNLGIGLPTKIASYLPADKDIFLHSENGLLAFGPPPPKGEEDPELINAGKEFVTMLKGGSFFHHGDSFAMMRGGHLDICVLGAFQVASNGDLANWHTGEPDAIPAVGGAMDLAIGAKKVFVVTEHVTRQGDAKIVEQLSYPVTGMGCVDRIYSDLCVIDVTDAGLKVIEMVPGLSFAELQGLTGAQLTDATQA
ncbi:MULTISPECIES: 3-oxoacid CoA-transferase subunit B [Pseudomonas]|uniref:3-oxoadipate CoA-transferase n=2 Tax=Pseudomonas TaxID=286 RepID=A0A2S9ET97_9PSED|nr:MULTISPECIES: 3-oxoacid CoA-transferase subunit B [Pseudomonas]PRA27919.1 3-oxoadipate CoA-transferase [Pseudomonas poae]PRC19023.1 3-oxoadipate CoA-transferase [Pseudomonas poae]TFY94165.1 3-oxoacid CoA-transferase subunit B [Pseudomonas nabeulensis]